MMTDAAERAQKAPPALTAGLEASEARHRRRAQRPISRLPSLGAAAVRPVRVRHHALVAAAPLRAAALDWVAFRPRALPRNLKHTQNTRE